MKTIVCGTDFSAPSREAARVAAAWAGREQCSLHLVHVRHLDAPDEALHVLQEAARVAAQRELTALAVSLHAECGVPVTTAMPTGTVYDELPREAATHEAGLIVVASVGKGHRHGWLLGSSAERVVQHAAVPVAVVRDAQPLLDWLRGGAAALPVLACADMTGASAAAVCWARRLRQLGPCDLQLAYVAWPPEAGVRVPAGVSPLAVHAGWDDLESELGRELQQWAAAIESQPSGGPEGESYRVLVNFGRADAALEQHAAATHRALVVVGNHRQSRVARLWQGSVTRALLHQSTANVVCVPPVERVGAA